MTEPTKEQKGIWLNEFYEWYKDCFSIDGDMAEQIKTQMFADMRYAYIAAKKSDFEELQKTREQLSRCEKLLVRFVPDERTIQWEGRELDARQYFKDKQGEGQMSFYTKNKER